MGYAAVLPFQKLFYNEWKIDPSRYDYNIVYDQEVHGELNVERLHDAVTNFINDYAIFNSHIIVSDENTYWALNSAIHGLEILADNLPHEQLLEYVKQPFNLETGPLYRFALVKLAEKQFRFIMVLHHILIDGGKFDLFYDTLSSYYNNNYVAPINFLQQQELLLNSYNQDSQKIELNDFKSAEFWQKKLSELDAIDLEFLKLPTKFKVNQLNIARIIVEFDYTVVNLLKILKTKYGISPYLYSELIYSLLIHRYSGYDKFAISYPILMNKNHDLFCGAYINTLFMPFDYTQIKSMDELFTQAKNFIAALKSGDVNYVFYPTEKILSKRASHLLNLNFVDTNFKDKALTFNNCTVNKINDNLNIDQVSDMNVLFNLTNDIIKIKFQFKEKFINRDLLTNFIATYKEFYQTILQQIVGEDINPQQINLNLIPLLNLAQYNSLIVDYNKTHSPYPADKTIHQIFEEQVLKTPTNIALVYEDKKLTYADLNARSNQLAHYLLAKHAIQADDLIALCLDRSEHMLITILGVLKSGGAYVPMDPGYPAERINYILKDTQAKVLLTNEAYVDKLNSIMDSRIKSGNDNVVLSSLAGHACLIRGSILSDENCHSGLDPESMLLDESCHSRLDRESMPFIFALDSLENQHILAKQKTTNPLTQVKPNNLAYVIYTSGTTGKPKGVMIEHKSVINTLFALDSVYAFKAGARVTAFTAYVFDVSVSEFFVTLCNGAELHLWSDDIRQDIFALSEYLLNYKISHTYLPPVLLSNLPRVTYPDLQVIVYAGEPCSHKTGLYWSENYKLYNYYGPTEASIYALGKQVINGDVKLIGKPLNNTSVYILDKDLYPLPVGAIGELYVGGVGLARGYLNLEDLTTEKFIQNPFLVDHRIRHTCPAVDDKFHSHSRLKHVPDQELIQGCHSRLDRESMPFTSKLYKTGDLVRMLPDGNIEYIGRNDFQIKIRGFRIELGEIESKLINYAGITQAVVVALERDATNKYLAAYYVAASELNGDDILSYLKANLPDYMVPATLTYLQQLPVTINGKLDRKTLPIPDFSAIDNYVAPREELEFTLVDIFAEILKIEALQIGIKDSFFSLGGNSLLAIKLVSRINKTLNLSNEYCLSVLKLFKHPTIQQIALYLEHSKGDNVVIPQTMVNETELLLSFAQQRLWFIDKYEGGSNAYNIPLVLQLSKMIDIEILKSSLVDLSFRHEILRTVIAEDEVGNNYQKILTTDLPIIELSIRNPEDLDNSLDREINYVYDLTKEVPIRAVIYKLHENNGCYLSLVIHHIAFDGWSTDILLNELSTLYNYKMQIASKNSISAELNLPLLSIQYKDFALWQRSYLTGQILENKLSYWRNKLSGYETLNLTTDKPRGQEIDYSGDYVLFNIEPEISNKLRQLARNCHVSLYTVLLSGFNLLLSCYSNQDDIVLGTVLANRHFSQIEHLVGFFVNSLALRSQINKSESLINYIKQTGQEVLDAHLHQDLPFEKLVEELNIKRDKSRHPIFQVLFKVTPFVKTKYLFF